MKLLMGYGVTQGFRGSKEHVFLQVNNIIHGVFEDEHEFAGYQYYGVDGILDKTTILSTNNAYVRDSTKDHMRLPVQDDDPFSSCLAGSTKRFLCKLSPGQIRIYCKVVPKNLRTIGGNQDYFYGNCPIGKEGIALLFKMGAKKWAYLIGKIFNLILFGPFLLLVYPIVKK